jgi:hypothetical protein
MAAMDDKESQVRRQENADSGFPEGTRPMEPARGELRNNLSVVASRTRSTGIRLECGGKALAGTPTPVTPPPATGSIWGSVCSACNSARFVRESRARDPSR